MEFNISTTGLNITLEDLGVTLTHPETLDLLLEVGQSDIIDSKDLEDALRVGTLTATDEFGRVVSSVTIANWTDRIKTSEDTIITKLSSGDNISSLTNDLNYTTETYVNNIIPTQLILNSGRYYLYTDNRWVTNSDDNYGASYQQFNESGGTGTEPIIEWEHMGDLIPAGKTIKNLRIAGRANNLQVTDLQIRVIFRHPNPITRWETGMDNDSEDTVFTLFSGNWATGLTGNMNDIRKRLFDLGDFITPEDGYLSIYVRPVGTLTGNRYFMHTYTYEIQ